MKHFYTCIFLFLYALQASAQDSVLARIILIGDAGEMDRQQLTLIPDAAAKAIPGKTTALFLGDNIYPHGMGLSGSKEEKKTQEIMQSQFLPMRSRDIPVYFIPGNHDWDRMGPAGLAKIKRQWAYLEEQQDSGLHLVPRDGCPDPVAIEITDSLVIIAMDSEWWLYPFDKQNPDAGCDCKTSPSVITALQELFYKHRYKTILLATHHPFQSYGTHGGYFSWKDHLFPFTAIHPNLYIPLPLAGSIYPLARRTFTNPEDLRHPLYREMIRNVDEVLNTPNLVHISGHEHGMQLIDNKETGKFQVVSGGGAKHNYTIKGKHSLFGTATQGYVIADLMRNNNMRFTYYCYEQGVIKQVFQYEKAYTPYHPATTASRDHISGDSITIQAHAAYAHPSGLYRRIMGDNYRAEWSQPVRLPLIRISEVRGGLWPVKLGGGFQSTSLRLKDKKGKEYTLRTVEKKPKLVVPFSFRGTFVREVLDDATSAQHPYSAVTVAPVAAALGIPHSTPVIGVVAPDPQLGMYEHLLEGKVCLLEEREPLGKSANYAEMQKALIKDNDNTYDARNFLKARMIDVLFADWDRHGDQWRFYNRNPKGSEDFFVAIPRDRDMALNITQGLLPTVVKRLFVMPRVYGFRSDVKAGYRYYLYKSSFLNAHPASQIGYREWMQLAQDFKQQVSDSVLKSALQELPAAIQPLRNKQLLQALEQRRDGIPEVMDRYYRFSNEIVDIRCSNKQELILATDADTSNGTIITILKLEKNGQASDTLVHKLYPRSITKEIRLYTGKGDDSVVIHNTSSTVKLRIIGGKGHKAYNILDSRKKILLYDREPEHYYGATSRLHKYLRDDSTHTAFVPVNLYNTSTPLLTAAINIDDGLLLGAGMRFTRQKGFRIAPYYSQQELMLSHSFSTDAFRLRYEGAWLHTFGHADLVTDADIKAPDNTQNFFGRGNETEIDRDGDFKRYYRARFNLLSASAALRWRGGKGSAFSIGPAIQYYHFDKEENEGRFINQLSQLGTYDSAFIDREKLHLGISARYVLDQRNNKILPSWGTYVRIDLQAMDGLNSHSGAFLRLVPELALYKTLNTRRTIILAERLGGGLSFGKTAFYQSIFLGGQGNLSGYRQYRFAGQHALYNNLEIRVILTDFGNYIFKGQLGLTGCFDIGRVWQDGEFSGKWHNGAGAGIYLSPASLTVLRFNMSYSDEGWYPNFAVGFRF